ncbi:MAG: hypothetical protein HFH80_06175 [Lachnospiraceae bacterium]|nr:hypothetical protein [Lachnospiraceae bacterium]
MKKFSRFLTFGILAVAIIVTNVQFVYAMDDSANMQIENRIRDELSNYVSEHNIPVSFENVKCDITYGYFNDTEELDNYVSDKIQYIIGELDCIDISLENKQTHTRGISDKGGYYTAKVESIVPAIGWGYVCQDFKASVSSGIISSITLQGNSYDTGVTLGSWEPNYSWVDISKNKRYCQIHMKGTVNYLWEGLNLSMEATFLATGKGNGSKIEDANYMDWPD